MEDNAKKINDIVSRTADILGTGKAFGGWSDDSAKESLIKPFATQLQQAIVIGSDHSYLKPQHTKVRRESITAENLESVRVELQENYEYYGILPEDVDNLTEEELAEAFPLLGMAAGMAAKWAGKKILGSAIRKGKNWVKGKAMGAVGKVASGVANASSFADAK
jgi:hypothetical protein